MFTLVNTRRVNMNTNLVFFQFLMVSNAFQISSLWRKGKKKENQLKDCRSDECKVKQAACLQDCQRGQAKGLGFCTAMSGTYAPFIEKYGEGYARENDGYLENLISKFCFKYVFYTYFKSIFCLLQLRVLKAYLWSSLVTAAMKIGVCASNVDPESHSETS